MNKKFELNLDKLDQEQLNALKERTGKSDVDILKLALNELHRKLVEDNKNSEMEKKQVLQPQYIPVPYYIPEIKPCPQPLYPPYNPFAPFPWENPYNPFKTFPGDTTQLYKFIYTGYTHAAAGNISTETIIAPQTLPTSDILFKKYNGEGSLGSGSISIDNTWTH